MSKMKRFYSFTPSTVVEFELPGSSEQRLWGRGGQTGATRAEAAQQKHTRALRYVTCSDPLTCAWIQALPLKTSADLSRAPFVAAGFF